MEPVDDRAEMIEAAKREQSDWEDWQPTDHDFWQALEGEEE